MKLRFTFIAMLFTVLAFCQDMEGMWVNSSLSGDENLAYSFAPDNTMKMYYAGTEIVTTAPIKYVISKKGDRYQLEMSYTRKSNGFSADLIGLVQFTGKDVMELEFFDKRKLPAKMNFTEESLMFVRK